MAEHDLADAFYLRGKRVLVTGASSGIGRETAILLSRLGGKLILVGRDEERLRQTHLDLDGEGHHFYQYDLVKVDGVGAFVERIVADTGPLYAVVHCAGLQQALPLRRVEVPAARELFDVNAFAAMMLIKAFRKRQCRLEDGRVVLISSVMGMVGAAGRSVYSMSKSALLGLVRSLAMELAGEGIRVNSISPGFVKTAMHEELSKRVDSAQQAKIAEMHPLGLGSAEDVAWGVCYLLGRPGAWITGTNLVIDGGYTAH